MEKNALVPAMTKLFGTLEDLAESLSVLPDAAALVRQSTDPVDALQRLCEAGQLTAAARLCAHALPPREAVWWACMCADHTAPADLAEADQMVRTASEQWVRKPSDDLRRTAMDLARAAGLLTPEAWTGVGAFWSGGSMAPIGQPAMEPARHLCGTAIAGSVLLASVRGDGARQLTRLQSFVASARDIAANGPGRIPSEDG